MDTGHVVARAGDIADGERMLTAVGGRSVGVFNVAGRYHAVVNRCPHRGGPLCTGDLLGTRLVCPWHGWQFDLATGASSFDPARSAARPFRLSADATVTADDWTGGEPLAPGTDVARFADPATGRIPGPYRAELIPVTVADGAVVLDPR